MELLLNIVDKNKARMDHNGIWVSDVALSSEANISKNAWEKIYNFDPEQLKFDRKDFDENKLDDHVLYIEKSAKFNTDTIYLEIGCGPAHIGEYLMKKYDCSFVGIDFNYPMLLTLNKYLKEKGYKKFILIYADMLKMPLKENSVDYIYGGGVIEHMSDSMGALNELGRVLKKGGVAFNTVPAFNAAWLVRFYNNIPYTLVLKKAFEFFHLKMLRNSILEKFYGYELSYTLNQLRRLHENVGFHDIKAGSFAFHPSDKRIKSVRIRSLFYRISKSHFFSPMYYVYARK